MIPNNIESLIKIFDFKKIETGLPKSISKSKNSYKENKFTHLHTVLNSDKEKYHMLELIFNSEIVIIFEYKRQIATSYMKIKSGVESFINRKKIMMCDIDFPIENTLHRYFKEYNHIIRKIKIQKLLKNEH